MLSNIFEHIYLVSLPHHHGRRLKTLAHLKDFGIVPTVFEASNGYLPPLLAKYESYSQEELGSLTYFSKFNKLETNRNKRFIESAGAFGYIATYIRILEDAKSKGYQSILIFEDDVLLSLDFNKRLEYFCSVVPKKWKFLGLGASQYGWDSVDVGKAKKKGYYTPKQLDTCGSFAIAIRETIYDELIQLQSYYEAPFDHLPLGEIYKKYASDCLIAFPYMVMPDVRSSSIRGSRNQLMHAQKMKWELELFKYPPKRPILNFILASKEEIKYLEMFETENSFPFELHLFIPSLDGLRPFHDASQSIEANASIDKIISPNSGYCVKSKNNVPITEISLISLYESLISKNKSTIEFEVLDTAPHKVSADRVSVIIPTYKRSENLKNVILSVIEQDYEDKEIIIVDDNSFGSDDQIETERNVIDLIRIYPDVDLIYVSQSRNRNGAGARNTGFLRSTGNYICFLDDDDLYLPGRLSLVINKLKTTPGHIGAVYCGFIGWNGATRETERYKEGNLTQELLSLDYLSHYLHTNTATYKRDAIITVNGFDETFRRHQDLEFNLRFFEYYEMSVVTEQLISLRPAPTTTNNQQYGINLFETKVKFLKKFEYIISRFDNAIQKIIYDKHWSETLSYVSDMKAFEKHLLESFNNGHLQCFSKLVDKHREIESKKALEDNVSNIDLEKTKVEKNIVESIDLRVGESLARETFLDGYNTELKSWQVTGASIFSLVFSKFILPQQQHKLKNQPKDFFEDSKNSFTRFVGKLLKII